MALHAWRSANGSVGPIPTSFSFVASQTWPDSWSKAKMSKRRDCGAALQTPVSNHSQNRSQKTFIADEAVPIGRACLEDLQRSRPRKALNHIHAITKKMFLGLSQIVITIEGAPKNTKATKAGAPLILHVMILQRSQNGCHLRLEERKLSLKKTHYQLGEWRVEKFLTMLLASRTMMTLTAFTRFPPYQRRRRLLRHPFHLTWNEF